MEKLSIKMTRSCFVSGEPCERGKVYAFAPLIAQELLAIGSAVPVSSGKPETATAKPTVERAKLPSPTAKKSAAKAAKKTAKKSAPDQRTK